MSENKRRADDEDLADLIGNEGSSPTGTETASLNLDHLTQSKVKMSPRKGGASSGPSFLNYISAYMSMLCYFYPRLCGTCATVAVILVLLMLANLFLNPTEEFGVIKHDHSDIRSKYDLSVGMIDHWCLQGDNDSCRCEDPLQPLSRAEWKAWISTFKMNRKMVKQFADPTLGNDLDVAFLGESVIEEMDGRWLGRERSPDLVTLQKTFRSHFSKAKGAKLNGVALGIAGDTAPNVLWRLMHGEMEDFFNPKVWWVSLGMNDLSRMKCSEEVVILGVLRVVEEILEKKPNAHVVINSLFPMAEARGDVRPVISDYKDSFATNKRKKGTANAAFRAPKPASSLKNTGSASTTNKGAAKTTPTSGKNQGLGHGHRRLGTENMAGTRAAGKSSHSVPKPKRTPEEVAAAIEKEEQARDKAARKKRHHHRAEPVNPILTDKHKIKKYRPATGFTQKTKLPLWTSINAINGVLRRFAEKQDRVSFFDATTIFAEREDGQHYMLMSENISARGHPTLVGYNLWEDAIVKRLDQILQAMKLDKPELFGPQPQDNNEDNTGSDPADFFDGDFPESDDFEDDALDGPADDFLEGYYNEGGN